MDALFILIRNDMDSMNLGRSCAMSSHITSCFEKMTVREGERSDTYLRSFIKSAACDWKLATDYGFGTVYIYGASNEQLDTVKKDVFEKLRNIASLPDNLFQFKGNPLIELGIYDANLVEDPEYHIQDGSTVHLLPVVVGGYLFGNAEAVKDFLKTHGINYL